ncbi:DUF4037 domain-containing protein [Dactylosporangium sucinum]|uniref:DUF4037 domain-containing protein n=1 Tax=Dactylosporangium sucinum TaxID=1424081 RepID=A0A917X750_9ACTN|nr:DUF4037 domain-containing protein [Dactylosporangium sucinum]GGM84263.1 hypothetical protein GCM10007977_102190 [Dactylosporangium sucinum]
MPEFLPGLRLCGIFYEEAVRPLLDAAYPGLPHAAARIGAGSEVLGYDGPRSTDHDWGPRLTLFLDPADTHHGPGIDALLRDRLPKAVRGWPTNFEPPGERVRVMTPTGGPVHHRVDVTTVTAFSAAQLGVPGGPRTAVEWLGTPAQLLLETTAGAVYHDGPGDLTALRERLAWYPDDVWRYLLAAQWTLIAQEEAFVGRAAEAGDPIGRQVLAARLTRALMRLGLLLHRRYPPYSKWLGTAWTGLGLAWPVGPPAGDPDRLADAYEAAGRAQNALPLAGPVDATRRGYHDRPYEVIDAGRFAAALAARITDPALAGLPLIGGIDQYADSTDVLTRPALCQTIMAAAYSALRGADPDGRPGGIA